MSIRFRLRSALGPLSFLRVSVHFSGSPCPRSPAQIAKRPRPCTVEAGRAFCINGHRTHRIPRSICHPSNSIVYPPLRCIAVSHPLYAPAPSIFQLCIVQYSGPSYCRRRWGASRGRLAVVGGALGEGWTSRVYYGSAGWRKAVALNSYCCTGIRPLYILYDEWLNEYCQSVLCRNPECSVSFN